MVRWSTSSRDLYYFSIVFTIFFFFVLTVNLYFVLIKEMLIYSNHFLIVSKLTNEDHKSYFTNQPLDDFFSEIDETDYYLYDFIDLSIYEFESQNSVLVENEEKNIDLIISEKIKQEEYDHFDVYQNDQIIHDKYYYSTDDDPFIEVHWIVAFEDEHDLKDETEEFINCKEEDEKPNLFFPKKDSVYDLNKNTYNYIGDNFDWEEEDGEINFISSVDCCLDDDSSEYWHEPLFIFGKIREMHYFRKPEDHFVRSFTTPQSHEWFDKREYDHNNERDSFS